MPNFLKLFLYSFKFIFSFLKNVFTKSSINYGDNRSIKYSNTDVSLDCSVNKGERNTIKDSFNTTTYNIYPTSQVSSSNSDNNNLDLLYGILFLVFIIFINNALIVPYVIPLRILITIFSIMCLLSYVHLFLIGNKRVENYILLFLTFIFTLFNVYIALKSSSEVKPIHDLPEILINNPRLFLSSIHIIFILPLFLYILISYSKEIFKHDKGDIFSLFKTILYLLLVLILLYYLRDVVTVLNHLFNCVLKHLEQNI